MKWRNVVIAALVLVPLIGLLAYGFGHDPHAVPFVLRDQPAPDFTLRSLDGTALKLSDLRGKPVVLNFWASWCEPCKLEHDLLQDAARYYGNGAQFLGIVYQDQEENVRRYLAEHVSNYPQLVDSKTIVSIDYGVAGVPESYLIDAAGIIREKSPGVLSGAELRRWLDGRVKVN